MKYRKKPVVVEAMQFLITDDREYDLRMKAFCGDDATLFWAMGKHETLPPGTPYCEIETLEGTMIALEGDWIIKGVKGEIYPCKPDIFEMTYEPVEETPDEF